MLSLKGNLGEIFASIDEMPLACLIAQVHAAKLVSGEDVVMKSETWC